MFGIRRGGRPKRSRDGLTHLVSQTELLLAELHTAAETLGNAEPLIIELAREFEADAAEARTTGRMQVDASRQFADDRPEVARLQTDPRRERAASFGRDHVSRERRHGR